MRVHFDKAPDRGTTHRDQGCPDEGAQEQGALELVAKPSGKQPNADQFSEESSPGKSGQHKAHRIVMQPEGRLRTQSKNDKAQPGSNLTMAAKPAISWTFGGLAHD
jgi:hypothetical protein